MMISSTKTILFFSCILLSKFTSSSTAKLDKRETVKIFLKPDGLPEYNSSIFNEDGLNITVTTEVDDPVYDSVVIVAHDLNDLDNTNEVLVKIRQEIRSKFNESKSYWKSTKVHTTDIVPSKKLIYRHTEAFFEHYDDVRVFSNVVVEAYDIATGAKSKNPLLVIIPPRDDDRFKASLLVGLLDIVQRNYLSLNERLGGSARKTLQFGLWAHSSEFGQSVVKVVKAFEAGRTVFRDICGGDPESMAPPKVWSYVQEVFHNSAVEADVMSGQTKLKKEMPFMAIVNRVTRKVPRHSARLILLNYRNPSPGPNVTKLFFVGKGFTFDTGGLGLHSGKGMSRHKCGAASVAGIMKIFSMLQPEGIEAMGIMPMVRNSVGAESMIGDEIVTARSGKKIFAVFPDVADRLVQADALAYAKDIAVKSPNPVIISIATLPGPGYEDLKDSLLYSYGNEYAVLRGNAPAEKVKMATRLQKTGELVADPFEVSRFRKEDLYIRTSPDPEGDLVPFFRYTRIGQRLDALILQMSGLDKHGKFPQKEIPVLFANTLGPHFNGFPGTPKASTVVAMASHFALSSELKDILGVADNNDKRQGSIDDIIFN